MTHRPSTPSRIPAPEGHASTSSSLPSSLPPLNVSPPSLGGPFASTSTSPITGRFSTATNASQGSLKQSLTDSEKPSGQSSKGNPLRLLRPQKSTSFEVSRPFNFTHNATASNMAMLNGNDSKAKAKPVITVSAPPTNEVAEDTEIYNAPRVAPTPPASKHRSSRFGFGSSKKDDAKKERRNSAILVKDGNRSTGELAGSSTEQPSPTPSLSPMLPAKMEFPIPPSSKTAAAMAGSHDGSGLAESFEHSPARTPTGRVPRHVTTSDTSDGEISLASTRSAPVRPARPASLIIPFGMSRPRSNSSQTVTMSSSPSSSAGNGKQSLSPRSRAYRTSRSPSPASPPPATPLPSPPTSATFPHSSDAEGWSTDASTRLGGWSTDTSTRIGSLASRKSIQSGSRVRAHTIVGSISKAPTVSSHSGMSSGGEDSERALRMSHGSNNRASAATAYQSRSANMYSRQQAKMKAAEKQLTVDASRESAPEDASLRTPTRAPSEKSQEVTPTREDTPAHSLRAAHDTYIRILQEKHAAEKAELLKRIDRLEREARKRDREIKGLRWLVLNANAQGNEEAASTHLQALDEELKTGRLRSGSKSSEISMGSSASRSRSTSGVRKPSVVSLDSPRESTEDGLKELQDQVSDLIAPWHTYTPRIEPADAERSGSPSSVSELRRSNTVPDMLAHAAAARHAKRTSSPVLPGGLGFDIPTIPGSESDVSTGGGESSSLPSLTASNTASSTQSSALSAIPEIASIPSEGDLAREKREKEERRASRALKRVSASSLMQAAQQYATNLKLGMSPSIGQVLDRSSRGAEEASPSDTQKKSRGGEH